MMTQKAAALARVGAPTTVLRRPVLQRRCSCGAQANANGGECEGCARKKLRRKADRVATRESIPASVYSVLGHGGHPLPDAARAVMEPRFGRDFSDVRVHTDAAAAHSATEVGALAYTVGRNVVFNTGQFAPERQEGLHLLAHELAHVVQQNGETGFDRKMEIDPPDSAAEREADRMADSVMAGIAPTAVVAAGGARIQRKVSPDFSKINRNLSYRPWDWAITDSEAHEVLVILQKLNPQDLADTVAAMQRSNILGRFYSNLPDDDVRDNQDFLRTVSRQQVWTDPAAGGKTATRKGSCSTKELLTISLARGRALGWLDKAIIQLQALQNAPQAPAQRNNARVFRERFNTLDLRVIDYARNVLRGVRNDFQNWAIFQLSCPGGWDRSCHKAGAYAISGPPAGATFCGNFFESGERFQAETLIHEFAHIQPGVAHITDRAYASDRAVRRLPTADALTNAESYALLAERLATGSEDIWAPTDTVEDCPQPWTDKLVPAAAAAQRSNRNAQVRFAKITPSNVATRLNAAELRWLGGTDAKTIEKALDAFDKAEGRFKEDIDFECEPELNSSCDDAQFYWYSAGDLHVCPQWLGLAPNLREQALLAAFYGYIKAGDNAGHRDRLAFLAQSVSQRGWAPTPLQDVLVGDAAWSPDMIRIVVVPDVPDDPLRTGLTEDGTRHERLHDDVPLFRGADCARDPLHFRERHRFRVDNGGAARRQPFLPPVLTADYVYTSTDPAASFTRHFEDRRPVYDSPGASIDHQLPDPVDLTLTKDGQLHSRIGMRDPDSGVNRVYDDVLQVRVEDPCPVVARPGTDRRVAVEARDRAGVAGLTTFISSAKTRIDTLLTHPAPTGEAWVTSANPNVRAVTTLLDSLIWDLGHDNIILRFDQASGAGTTAHYDIRGNEMHLVPLATADRARLTIDLVHEYANRQQDRRNEIAQMLHQQPVSLDREAALQQEIGARRQDTYLMRLLQLAGVAFAPQTDVRALEATARTFVTEFERERTGTTAQRRAATKTIHKQVSAAFAQQLNDHGSFGEFPVELTDDGHVRLYDRWRPAGTPAALGQIPASITTLPQLEAELAVMLHGAPRFAQLFVGPRKQAYDRVLFTVYFRRRVLTQFGFRKPPK